MPFIDEPLLTCENEHRKIIFKYDVRHGYSCPICGKGKGETELEGKVNIIPRRKMHELVYNSLFVSLKYINENWNKI